MLTCISTAQALQKIAAAMAALDSLMAHPGVSKVARAAGAIGMFCPLKTAGHKTIGPTTVDPRVGAPDRWTIEKGCQGKNEPGTENSGVRDHEPTSENGLRDHEPIPGSYSSPEDPLGAPRLCVQFVPTQTSDRGHGNLQSSSSRLTLPMVKFPRTHP